jgi:hypothetical protein
MKRGFQVFIVIWLCSVLSSCMTNQMQKKPVALDKGIELTLTAKKPGEGSIEVNQGFKGIRGNYSRSIERGLEVSFSFENKTQEPQENYIIASQDPELSPVVIIEDNKKIAPAAMKFEGHEFGYHTLDELGLDAINLWQIKTQLANLARDTPIGFPVPGCQDNPPAVAYKDGKKAGAITVFCTKPGEKDTVVVMFPKDGVKTLSEITVKVECKLCPKEGLTLKTTPE